MHFNHQSEGAAVGVVSLPTSTFANNQDFPLTVFSGVKFDNDGNVYKRQQAGGWSSIGSWLQSGSAGGFYVSRTITSGTLTNDAGAGPLVMSTDRIYDIQDKNVKATSVIFNVSSDVSGVPVVDSISYDFEIVEFS